jgi:hypothetical protein
MIPNTPPCARRYLRELDLREVSLAQHTAIEHRRREEVGEEAFI